MADCVKLSVIDAIAAEVEGVSRIKSVTVSPSTPIERDTTQMPAAFLFDEDESVTARNRVEQGTFRLTIQIYREGYAYRRELENDRAEVKKSLYAATQNDGALHALSARVHETSSGIEDLEVAADSDGEPTVGVGRIVVVYEVVYLTKYRDPFTQADY